MNKQFAILLLLLANLLFAQRTSSLKTFESSEITHKVKTEGILSKHISKNGETAIIRFDKSKIIFDVFDEGHQKLSSEHVGNLVDEEKVDEIFFDNKIVLFTRGTVKKTKTTIFCHVFNIQERAYEKKKFFHDPTTKNIYFSSSTFRQKSSFVISANGAYFAFSLNANYEGFKSTTIYVYNFNTLELIYNKEYLRINKGEKQHVKQNDLFINNSAEVYVLSKFYHKRKKEKSRGMPNYNYDFCKINPDTKRHIIIEMQDNHIETMAISTNMNQFHLLGLFSDRSIEKVSGACSYIIDMNSFSLISSTNYALPPKVFQDLYSSEKSKRERELSNFYINFMLIDDNGNTYVTAEAFYETSTPPPAGPTFSGGGHRKIHYDDILILKFNNKGELEWGRSLLKKANRTSYNTFLKNNKLHIIMNSGKSMKKKSGGRIKISHAYLETSALYDIVFDNDGTVSYQKIQNNKGNNYYRTEHGIFENNKFLMIGSKGVRKRYMVLE